MFGARPIALITGASSGIGAALAREFAAHGHELVLVARREHELSALADEIANTGRARPLVLPLDLALPDVARRMADALAALGVEPQYVVNNAGFGLIGAAAEIDRAAQLSMIDLNMRALTDLSLAFVESLVRHGGGILNVGSLAGFMPGPRMATYYASKAYVISFSEALHAELKPKGVRVTVLCPGPVPTEFQTRAGAKQPAYPPLVTHSAERMAVEGYNGLMRGRRMIVPGLANKIVTFVPRILPRGLLLRAVGLRQLTRRPRRKAC